MKIPTVSNQHWLWGAIRQLVADPAAFLARQAARYGDIVQFRLFHKKIVLLNHPDLIEEVLVRRADIFPKDRRDVRILSRFLGHGLITALGQEHAKQRLIIQPAFHRQRVAAYAEAMVGYAADLADAWAGGETRDMAHEMEKLTMYIVVKTLFDLDKDAMTGTGDEIGEAIKELQILTNRDIKRPRFVPRWLFFMENRHWRRYRRILDEAINDIIRSRRAQPADRGDLLSMLLQARYTDGTKLTDREIRDQLVTMFFAGHETTSSALVWTWYYLAQDPACEARLHAELDRVLAGRLPTLADLDALTYLDMVFKEAMRIQPPVWILSRVAAADTTVGGYPVKKGTMLFISQYALHRHPRLFSEPERFDPERFGPDSPQAPPRCAYLPFGGGPRACIGEAFAAVEARLIMAVLCRQYRFLLDPDQQVQAQYLVTTKARYGLKMQAQQRWADPVPGRQDHGAQGDLRQQVADWSFREPHSQWKSLWRKAVAFRTLARIVKVDSQEEFCRRVAEVRRQAMATDDRHVRAIGVWSVEKLSFALVTGRATVWTLNDERLPGAVQPVAHAGLGIGAIYRFGLRPLALTRFIDEHAHPDYRIFAYEALGTGWSALAKRWFRGYFRLVAGTRFFRTGLYDPREFLRRFPVSEQNAIAHGLGRGLYFNSLSMGAALQAVRRQDYLYAPSMIRGIAFASTIVNYRDLPHCLDIGYRCTADKALGREICLGVRAALLLWEWNYPGFIAACHAENEFQQQQLDDARAVADPTRYAVSF